MLPEKEPIGYVFIQQQHRTTPKTMYFFDSYGKANPPKELEDRLVSNIKIRINIARVQRTDESYPICGHLCLAFLKLMELQRNPQP